MLNYVLRSNEGIDSLLEYQNERALATGLRIGDATGFPARTVGLTGGATGFFVGTVGLAATAFKIKRE